MKLPKWVKFHQEDRKDFCKTEAKLSLRAWFFATAFSIAISLLVPYFDLTMPQARLGITALPIASFAVLFLLVVFFNPLFCLLRFPFSQQELLACFVAVMVVSGIASLGMTGLLVQYLVGPHYFATSENRIEYAPEI